MAIVEALSIQGGVPLRGTVAASGGKNAAVAIIPAALMASSPCTIEHMPDVDDVKVLVKLLRWLGAKVDFENGVMRIDPSGVDKYNPPYELTRLMRASYYLVPVLVSLFGRAEVPFPGGCDIGARPFDQTVKGWSALGAKVDIEHGAFVVEASQLRGVDVHLDMPSVGATINTMLLAVAAEGMTISKSTRSNLDRIASGQTSYPQVLTELRAKYEQPLSHLR